MSSKIALASVLAVIALSIAPAVFADEGQQGGLSAGLHLGQFVRAHVDGSLNHKDRENDADDVDVHANASTSPRAQWEEKLSHIAVGVVTSINGSVFTIDPFGAKSTTTVTTTAGTTFNAKGNATTSAALHVGSKVFLVGTTTATSTTGDSFTASLVDLIGKGLGHLRFWMWFHHG